MSNVFFTSDSHYFHSNIIPYCSRPFGSYERFGGTKRDDMEPDMLQDYLQELDRATLEMNETLIENHNSVVTSNSDRVYHLGDFGIGNFEKLNSVFSRLRGQHMLVKGNHDSKDTLKLKWQAVYEVKGITVDKQYIWMSHYPHRSWNRAYHSSFHAFGHVHGRCLPWGYSCDVGVDSWDYKPVAFEELKALFSNLPMMSDVGVDSFVPQGYLWRGRENRIEQARTGDPINGIV